MGHRHSDVRVHRGDTALHLGGGAGCHGLDAGGLHDGGLDNGGDGAGQRSSTCSGAGDSGRNSGSTDNRAGDGANADLVLGRAEIGGEEVEGVHVAVGAVFEDGGSDLETDELLADAGVVGRVAGAVSETGEDDVLLRDC